MHSKYPIWPYRSVWITKYLCVECSVCGHIGGPCRSIANVLVSIISLFESFQKSVWLYENRTFDNPRRSSLSAI